MDMLAQTGIGAGIGRQEVVDEEITTEVLVHLFTLMKKVTKWMPKLI